MAVVAAVVVVEVRRHDVARQRFDRLRRAAGQVRVADVQAHADRRAVERLEEIATTVSGRQRRGKLDVERDARSRQRARPGRSSARRSAPASGASWRARPGRVRAAADRPAPTSSRQPSSTRAGSAGEASASGDRHAGDLEARRRRQRARAASTCAADRARRSARAGPTSSIEVEPVRRRSIARRARPSARVTEDASVDDQSERASSQFGHVRGQQLRQPAEARIPAQVFADVVQRARHVLDVDRDCRAPSSGSRTCRAPSGCAAAPSGRTGGGIRPASAERPCSARK